MSRLRHVGWNQCSHGLDSRPLESCHHQCLKAMCGVLGYPKGSALELLDGTLKLRYCTALFTKRFPPWSLPNVGYGVGKSHVITPGHLPDAGGNGGTGVRLTRKDSSRRSSSHHSGSRASNAQGDGKDCAPLPPKEREVRWACLAIFFLDLGLGEVCTGDAWNLLSDATGVGFFSGWSVQPKGSVHWH